MGTGRQVLVVAVQRTLDQVEASTEQTAHDADEDLTPLLALLDAFDDAPGAAELRARTYELLGVAPGTRLLDAGCGGGRAVEEAARLGAHAVGVDVDVDVDPRMVSVAHRRVPRRLFALADVCALPYLDGAFDAYRADKVCHALADPAAAGAEARRVLAPDGRIALLGQDWDTLVIDADDPQLTRTLVHARADQVPSPRAARRYRALLRDAGFRDVRVEVHTGVFTDRLVLPMLTGLAEAARAAGAVSRDEAETWTADQRQRAETGHTLVAVPVFLATATR